MSDCEVTVNAGVCKMKTVIRVKQNDDMTVSLDIESDCPMVRRTPFPNIVPWEEIGLPMNQSVTYKWASENIGHTACPVPCAILKAIEIGGDLGLKKDVSIEIR